MIVSLVTVIMLTAGSAHIVFADPLHCDQPGWLTCYSVGYSQGKTQARTDYYAYANDYRPFCPVYDAWTAAHGPHSSNFCAGFIDGYNAQWNALASQHNARVTQSTDQSVSIRGDNNKVVQQTINNVGDSGSSRSSRGHSGYQPACTFLCSIIKVN